MDTATEGKMSPVATELDKQSTLLKQLEELTAKLCNRLEFVSRGPQPETVTNQSAIGHEVKSAKCNLGEQIDRHNGVLAGVIKQLQIMLKSLEI